MNKRLSLPARFFGRRHGYVHGAVGVERLHDVVDDALADERTHGVVEDEVGVWPNTRVSGWAAKVMTPFPAEPDRSFTAFNRAWCPRWTPSKKPSA